MDSERPIRGRQLGVVLYGSVRWRHEAVLRSSYMEA